MTSYRADKEVIDTHTQTDTANDNTRRPKLASGNKNGRNAVNTGERQSNSQECGFVKFRLVYHVIINDIYV